METHQFVLDEKTKLICILLVVKVFSKGAVFVVDGKQTRTCEDFSSARRQHYQKTGSSRRYIH